METIKYGIWDRLTILVLVLIFTPALSSLEIGKARMGVLNLYDWDFKANGPVELSGEWLYVLGHENGAPERPLREPNVIDVPAFWNTVIDDGQGTMTYFLTVRLPDSAIGSDMGLYLKQAYTCYELYVNGKKMMGRGVIRNSKGNIPQFLAAFSKIEVQEPVLHIRWIISNYHDRLGGAFYPIVLGLFNDIERIDGGDRFITDLQLFFIFTIFLFHLSLWFCRKKEVAYLIFSLCAFSVLIRTIGANNIISLIVREPIGWIYSLEIKMIYLGGILASYLFPLFFDRYYKLGLSKIPTRIFMSIAIFLGLLLFITDESFFSSINIFLQIIAVACGTWIIVFNLVCMRRRLEGSGVFFLGILVFFCTMINDIIFSYIFIFSTNLLPFGFMAFIFSMSTVLIIKLTKLLLNEEYLTSNLKMEVHNRTLALKEESQKRTDFFINIAHEIKTPLTLVRNYLGKYLREHPINDDLKIIKSEIDKLTRDILNFMDTEKIERGKLNYENGITLDLSAFIAEILKVFEVAAEEKNIRIEAEIQRDIICHVMPAVIDRILNNLIENAIRYTEQNGFIHVSLRKEGGHVVIAVRDTGIGIAKEKQKYIFDKYYQITRKKSNIQGMGMGLYLVNDIVNTLGGSITLESEVGQGSLFTVKLPFVLKDGEKAEEGVAHIDPLNLSSNRIEVPVRTDLKYSVLLVEDNIDLLNYLGLEIAKNFRTYTAINGKEALGIIKRNGLVDIIISDVMMDVMDGYQFFEELQKVPQFKSIPFIFISAKAVPSHKIKALKQGAVDYIYKPFEIDELLNKINSIVKVQEIQKLLVLEEKYAMIGKLASGITHQIYNPLSAITAPAYYVRKEIRKLGIDEPKINEAFEDITKNVKRIEEMIKSLKFLSYSKIDTDETVNLRNIVSSIVNLYSKDIRGRINFILDFDEDFTIHTNANALINIIMNIIQNSVDAIDQRGYIRISVDENDSGFAIIIEDNGKGIEWVGKNKIFDMDFTTKGIGKGTGLGLYIVKNLADKINLVIKVESEKDKGTTFKLIKDEKG